MLILDKGRVVTIVSSIILDFYLIHEGRIQFFIVVVIFILSTTLVVLVGCYVCH